MPIGGATGFACVIGWPVAHTLSPRLHNHWLDRNGIDAVYLPMAVSPTNLPTALAGLAALGCRGANLTLPHKVAALSLCSALAPSAQGAGAVNTLVFGPGGGITGHNTDGAGFLQSLTANGVNPAALPWLILGAGGAARAIAAAALHLGCRVQIASRRPDQAQALATTLPGLNALPWPSHAPTTATLIVNATAAGMHDTPPLALDLSPAAPASVIADIVYAPRRTPLLAAAEALGLKTIGGIDMLIYQAAAAFQAWFGIHPAPDAALRALLPE